MDNNPEPNIMLAILNVGALVLLAGGVFAGLFVAAAWIWRHL